MAKKKKTQPLFSVRIAVILQAAVFIGIISGWLSFLVTQVMPGAVGSGLAAACTAVVLLHKLIDEA